jgi:predicted  nucleic acid-binding Zn-ribbon protein
MRWLSSILVALSLAASCGDDKPAKGEAEPPKAESQTREQLAARLADINERLSSARHRAIDVADRLAQARTELTQHPTPEQATELTKKIETYTQQNADLSKEIDEALKDQHKLMKDLAAQPPAGDGSASAPP